MLLVLYTRRQYQGIQTDHATAFEKINITLKNNKEYVKTDQEKQISEKEGRNKREMSISNRLACGQHPRYADHRPGTKLMGLFIQLSN